MNARWHAELRWEDVLFVNWPVEPSAVAPKLPDSLALDVRDGRAWVSVVALVMADVGPPGVPGGVTFSEVNLRTYVDDGEPAVYFFSIESDEPIGTRAGRLVERASSVTPWRIRVPYHRADVSVERDGDVVSAESERRGECAFAFAASARPDDERAFTPAPRSVASFLTDRYRFYAPVGERTDGGGERTRLASGRVAHGAWRLRPAAITVLRDDLFAAAGLSSPTTDPLAYYCPRMPSVAAQIGPPRSSD